MVVVDVGVGVLAILVVVVVMTVAVGMLATMVQIAEVRERRTAISARTAVVRSVVTS